MSKEPSAQATTGTAPSTSPHPGNGTTVFHVLDPEGFDVILEIERWDHIVDGHPEVKSFLDLIKETIGSPEVILQDGCRKETHYYYKLSGRSILRRDDLYMVAVVRRSNTDKTGTVRTAYFVKQVRKGVLVWLKRK